VGVSVVNALSRHLEVIVRRDGNVYQMKLRDGEKVSELTPIGTAPKRMTGTTVRFWPDEKYFDSSKF
jgi:topoisomerase-4 subunit B